MLLPTEGETRPQITFSDIPEELRRWVITQYTPEPPTSRSSLPDILPPLKNYPYNNFREELKESLIFKKYSLEIKFINKIDSINSKIRLRENPIRNNNFPILERHLDSTRDRIIERVLDRWMRGQEVQENPRLAIRPQVPPVMIPESPTSRFSSDTGLRTRIEQWTSLDQPFTVKGQQLLVVGNRYAVVDFTPDRRTYFDPNKMTDSVTRVIRGTVELLRAIDQGKFEDVSILTGRTNLHMALFAQRLGFEIVDSCLTPEGNVDKRLTSYVVVGRLYNIRRRVAELSQRHLSRLEQRNRRLQPRHSLAN